jgi:hypothetical protein
VKTGTLVVKTDAWCELSIDGTGRGRVYTGKERTFELPAGDHPVLCVGGTGRWAQRIKVGPGAAVTARAVVLRDVRVTVALTGATIDGKAVNRGATIVLRQGDHRIAVGGRSTKLSIPMSDCTIRDDPRVACYPNR